MELTNNCCLFDSTTNWKNTFYYPRNLPLRKYEIKLIMLKLVDITFLLPRDILISSVEHVIILKMLNHFFAFLCGFTFLSICVEQHHHPDRKFQSLGWFAGWRRPPVLPSHKLNVRLGKILHFLLKISMIQHYCC